MFSAVFSTFHFLALSRTSRVLVFRRVESRHLCLLLVKGEELSISVPNVSCVCRLISHSIYQIMIFPLGSLLSFHNE